MTGMRASPITVIPGSRFARPGMTTLNLREAASGLVARARQQPFLDRLDLQRQIFRVDAALRETAGDEPEAGLAGARIHVAQFLPFAKSPDRPDPRGNLLAEQLAHQMLLRLVAGR